ncbi:MAG: MmcB family DNA repair protein [Hyphomicrobiaceae bacterium]|nr:MmcB family DNA repair protein [Hyphomicrobiaceae bacterium]
MPLLPSEPDTPADWRPSPAALDIGRGVARLLHSLEMATVSEVSLANGRRADVVGITGAGEIWIVEIKSSIEDYRADHKWPEYRPFCDRFFFAVGPSFPRAILPADTGLMVADRYGGEVMRGAPEHRLSGARRKALTLKLVHTAAMRLEGAMDPDTRRRHALARPL